ncbi:hypothetical protein F5I97DRAFT_1461917 [Phlebopus sp. FC_14]|nr:hypothetical protein F5I97DRAFT_1461917 [Phlebopus sp. FC_14]
MATAAEEGQLHVSSVLQPITNGSHSETSIALDDEAQTVLTKKATSGSLLDDATETVDKVTVDVIESPQQKSFVDGDSTITLVSDNATVAESATTAQEPVEVPQSLGDIPPSSSDKENLTQANEPVTEAPVESESEPVVDSAVEATRPLESVVDASASDATEPSAAQQTQEAEDIVHTVETHIEQPPPAVASSLPQLAELPVADASPAVNTEIQSVSHPLDTIEIAESRAAEVLASEQEAPELGPTSVTNDIADEIINEDSNATNLEERIVSVSSKPEEAVAIEVDGPSPEVEIATQEVESPEDSVIRTVHAPELSKSAKSAFIEVSEEASIEPEQSSMPMAEVVVEQVVPIEATSEVVEAQAEVAADRQTSEVIQGPKANEVSISEEAIADPVEDKAVETPEVAKEAVEPEVVSEVVPAGIPPAEVITVEENAEERDVSPLQSETPPTEVTESVIEPAAEAVAPAEEIASESVTEESPLATDTTVVAETPADAPSSEKSVEETVAEEVSPPQMELPTPEVEDRAEPAEETDEATVQADAVVETVKEEVIEEPSTEVEAIKEESLIVVTEAAETVPLSDEAHSAAPTEPVEIEVVGAVPEVAAQAAEVEAPNADVSEVPVIEEPTTIEALETTHVIEVETSVVEAAESTPQELVTETPATDEIKVTEPIAQLPVEDVTPLASTVTAAEEAVVEPELATATDTEETPDATKAAGAEVTETIPTESIESIVEPPAQEEPNVNASVVDVPTEEPTSATEDAPVPAAAIEETVEIKSKESAAEADAGSLVTETPTGLEVDIKDASIEVSSEETPIVAEAALVDEDSSADVPIAIEGPTPEPSIMEEPEVATSIQPNETIEFGSFIPPEEAVVIEQEVVPIQQQVQEEAPQEDTEEEVELGSFIPANSDPVVVERVEDIPVVVSEVVEEEADDEVEHGSFIIPDAQPPATPELVIKTELDYLTPADSTPLERPKSPWTPSYSVTQQGPGGLDVNDEEELESLDQLPEPVVSEPAPSSNASSPDVSPGGLAEPVVSEATYASSAPTLDTPEDVPAAVEPTQLVVGEVVTAGPVTTSPTEPPVETAVTAAEEVVGVEHSSFMRAGSEPVEQDVTPAPQPTAEDAQDVAEESVQVELGSFIPPGSELAELEAVAPAPTVAGQASDEVEEESDEVIEHGSFIVETASQHTGNHFEVSTNSLAPSGSITPERPKSPWTPSYSVTKQGPGGLVDDDKELDELDQLPESVVTTAVTASEVSAPMEGPAAEIVEEATLPEVVVTETQATTEASLPVPEGASNAATFSEETGLSAEKSAVNEAVTPDEDQTSPKEAVVEVEKVSKKPSLSAVDELSASNQTEQASSLHIDIPALPSAVEEDKEKKSRWCIIM